MSSFPPLRGKPALSEVEGAGMGVWGRTSLTLSVSRRG
jgi:hypothetical protein